MDRPDIINFLVDLIGRGTFQAEVTVELADGSEMTCIQAKIDID